MNQKRLMIEPKRKGDDGYRTFSIRIRKELVARLETLCAASGYSRNELISLLLEYAAENCEIAENPSNA